MGVFIFSFIVGWIVMTIIMHPVHTFKTICWAGAVLLVVCGAIACFLGNPGNGRPCVVYGIIGITILVLTGKKREE